MLGYFPVSYKDELLYSLVARYALHTGLAGHQKKVTREVFSSPAATAVPDLPSHLHALVENLKLVWPVNEYELISNYTLAPIYLPFLSNSQAMKVVWSMISDSGGEIHNRVGISASKIKQHRFFRYCPKCLTEQESSNGEAYWKRDHQLPGIEFCGRHYCYLEHSSVYFHPKEKHRFFAAESIQLNAVVRKIDLTSQEIAILAQFSELLKSTELTGLGCCRWTLFYQNLAADLGFVYKSRVQHSEIHHLLKKSWAGTLFESFFRESHDRYWLTNIFRKHRKSFHPLRHLLITTALAPDCSIQQILNIVRGLPEALPDTLPIMKKVAINQPAIDEHRRRWKSFIYENPDIGVKELRGMACGGAIYAWLYRNDREWLMSNRPAVKKTNIKKYNRSNYENWDIYNLTLLDSIYSGMVGAANRKRITRSRLINALPRSSSVDKHLSKMPKTASWIFSHEESVADFQLYRLHKAYNLILSSNRSVKRWRLLRIANINKERITQKIEVEIKNMESNFE